MIMHEMCMSTYETPCKERDVSFVITILSLCVQNAAQTIVRAISQRVYAWSVSIVWCKRYVEYLVNAIERHKRLCNKRVSKWEDG